MGKQSLDSKCWPDTFSPDSANSWMRLTNQKLGPDIWQELSAVQSPENTIFSASTMKTKVNGKRLYEGVPSPLVWYDEIQKYYPIETEGNFLFQLKKGSKNRQNPPFCVCL